jgi:hypothetical protein
VKAVRYSSKTNSWKRIRVSSLKLAKLRAQESKAFSKDGTPKLILRLSARFSSESLHRKRLTMPESDQSEFDEN